MYLIDLIRLYCLFFAFKWVLGYKEKLHGLVTIQEKMSSFTCKIIPQTIPVPASKKIRNITKDSHSIQNQLSSVNQEPRKFRTFTAEPKFERDPVQYFEGLIRQVLYGVNEELQTQSPKPSKLGDAEVDVYAHAPSGTVLRSELFFNKSGVHFPPTEMMHRGHCYLRLTYDYMQTAINAFAIILHGNIDDILRLPPEYLLRSARTISMMKVPREKYIATWTVIKGDYDASEITYEILEMYRPLFKYLNGREIAKLNLSDPKILSYIGTHDGLDRHQMGVVASRYIKLNPDWREPMYLNLMNNLLCGVPMTFMRRVPENTYLQLSNQLFFHIRACDPLQRRFYLAMMSRTQVLGKSNSWRARDVSRLGLLLTEVDGPDLSTINPEAFVGLSAHVIVEMSPSNLVHITDKQIEYLSPKVRNILANKLKNYFQGVEILNTASILTLNNLSYILTILLLKLIK